MATPDKNGSHDNLTHARKAKPKDVLEFLARVLGEGMPDEGTPDDQPIAAYEAIGPQGHDTQITHVETHIPMGLQVVVIGTHEAGLGFSPIKDATIYKVGIEWKKNPEDTTTIKGWLAMVADGTITMCLDGCHVLIDAAHIFDTLAGPEASAALAEAREKFNATNPKPAGQ